MAYDYEIVAWEGFPRRGQSRGNRYGLKIDRNGEYILPRANRVHGIKVILTNTNNPSDTHQYWLHTLVRFNKWGQWYVFIVAMGESHNFEFADYTIPESPADEGVDE